MRYYQNDIYPIALVLSHDCESVNEHYYNVMFGPDEPVSVKDTSEAECMFLTRRTDDYYAMAVGIIFNKKEPKRRLQSHEAFHATRFMMEIGLHIPLSDESEEAWAYLNGWLNECVENYVKSCE